MIYGVSKAPPPSWKNYRIKTRPRGTDTRPGLPKQLKLTPPHEIGTKGDPHGPGTRQGPLPRPRSGTGGHARPGNRASGKIPRPGLTAAPGTAHGHTGLAPLTGDGPAKSNP